MNTTKLYSLVCRVFFAAAFLLFGLSVLDKVLALAGTNILGGSYTAGRLFEFATLLMIFVIALLLREIRQELKENKSGKT